MEDKKKEFFEKFTTYSEAHFEGYIKVMRNGKIQNVPFTPDLVWDWFESKFEEQRQEFVKDLEEEMPDEEKAHYEAENGLEGLLVQREVLLRIKSKWESDEE